jgi:low temperature requirement protein LtrA
MASKPERLLRGSDAPLSASFLELFFDLAFVLALSQTAQHLLHNLTLGSVLAGVALQQGLHGRAGLFAGAYVGVHLLRGMVTVTMLRGHPRQRRALRILCWYSVTAVLWLAGVLLPAWRVTLWVFALVIDLTGPRLGWPTPRLGRAEAGPRAAARTAPRGRAACRALSTNHDHWAR